MGKKKKKTKSKITMERILGDPIAKRLYVSLIPLDHLIRDLRADIEDGDLEETDPHYQQIEKLRAHLVQLLEDVLVQT